MVYALADAALRVDFDAPSQPCPAQGRGIAYGFEEAIAGSHKMDLRSTPRAQVESVEKFKKAFRRLPDPRADNARHELLEVLFIALAGECVAPRAPRTWPRLGNPRKGCCGWSCSCSTGCPATILSAGSSACWTRRRSRPHSAGSWQASPRPTDWNCAVWWRWMAKPCAVPSSVAGKHPAARWSTSGQRRRECAWLSAKLPAATRQRGRWKSWACWTSKAVSLPRMQLHCHRDFASTVLERGADYVLALKENQSKLFARGRSALCAQRSPQRCRTARTRHSRSLRVAARDRPARYHFRRGPEVPGVVALARITSRRRVLGACAERSPGARRPALQIYSRQATAAHRALAIGGSRTSCIGYSMSSSTRIATELAKTTRPRTLLSSESSPVNLVRSHPAATSLRQKIKRAGWDDALGG